MRKYSKASGFYLTSKQQYFEANDRLLAEARAQNRLYVSQPRRGLCKICQQPLGAEDDFHSHGVSYVFCDSCGHLNGRHEDSEAFVEQIYIADSGADYSKLYLDGAYEKRTSFVVIS